MIQLNEMNFLLYAAASYTNSVKYDIEEFNDDLNKFKYIKRLFSRYTDNNDLKERLILNHIVTLYNVFERKATTRMLFFRVDEKHWPELKTFLIFLGTMPERIENIDVYGDILSCEIPIDMNIAEKLRNL